MQQQLPPHLERDSLVLAFLTRTQKMVATRKPVGTQLYKASNRSKCEGKCYLSERKL